MSEQPDVLAEGTVLAGRFRIVRVLGAGGMGAVYEIEHLRTRHRRALKLLHREVAKVPGVVERFHREASAAGRIGNPHIVETFDAGELETGEPYLVMELLEGEPLAARLERVSRLSHWEAKEIGVQAAQAIHSAHEAGIVHRDLKPDNLFVGEREGKLFVKVLDFGISKFADEGSLGLTTEGTVLGTPYYMSPEQIRGATSVDASTDVYSLGVILYQCLSGVRPFVASSLSQLAILINDGEHVPLGEHCPELPPAFIAAIEKAMHRDRASRFTSAKAFASALLGQLDDGTAETEAVWPSAVAGRPLSMPAVSTVTRSSPALSKKLLVGAAVVAVASALVALALKSRTTEPTAASEPSAVAVSSSAPRVEPLAPAPAASEPAVRPALEAPDGSVSAAPGVARSAAPLASQAPSSGGPASKAPPRPSARPSDVSGLATENPF